jgi:hypothetical protein
MYAAPAIDSKPRGSGAAAQLAAEQNGRQDDGKIGNQRRHGDLDPLGDTIGQRLGDH